MYVAGPKSSHVPKPNHLVLCGTILPWVEKCDHLGHTLSSDGSLDHDAREKRASFIDSTVKTREMFGFAHPQEQILAMEKYCISLYGSTLWRLDSKVVESICATWNTAIKLAWNVPRACRSYLKENVLAPDITPLFQSLLQRSHGFFLNLM